VIYDQVLLEAEMERDFLNLSESDALLNEEVFLVQLNRRATLLNDEFQHTVLQIVSSHSLPDQSLENSELEFQLDVDNGHELHKALPCAEISHVAVNITDGIPKGSDAQGGPCSFQKDGSEQHSSLIADALFYSLKVPEERNAQKFRDSAIANVDSTPCHDNLKNKNAVMCERDIVGSSEFSAAGSGFQIQRGDSGLSYGFPKLTKRFSWTFFNPVQQSRSTSGHESFEPLKSTAGLSRCTSERLSSHSSHALQIRCRFQDCTGMVSVCSAPVKTLSRMREKIREYSLEMQGGHGSSWPLSANILDPIRASIVCEGPSQILEVFRWFSNDSSDGSCDEPVKMRVCRIKNKFSFPKEELVGGSVLC